MSDSDDKFQGKNENRLPAEDDAGIWQGVMYLHLARSYRDKGELDKAALYYEKALGSMPKSKTVSFEYSRVLKEIGRDVWKEEVLRVEDLSSILENRGWGFKDSLYREVFEFAELDDAGAAVGISVVVASACAEPGVLGCVGGLSEQLAGRGELILVNNGGEEPGAEKMRALADKYVKLRSSVGVYSARNIGALFSSAPVILFLDDDAVPAPGLIDAHISLHSEYEIFCARGAAKPGDTACLDDSCRDRFAYYYLGDLEFPCICNLDSNVSYRAAPFFAVYGWDDAFWMEGGGIDIGIRLSGLDPDMRKQIYSPRPLVYHDFAKDEGQLREKLSRQQEAVSMLGRKYPQLEAMLETWQLGFRRPNLLIERKKAEHKERHLSRGGTIPVVSAPASGGNSVLVNALSERGWEAKVLRYQGVFSAAECKARSSKPEISVIVVSWRFREDTALTIQQLLTERQENFELIFVNNGAEDAEFKPLRPYVDKWLRLNRNVGAYLSRNIGAAFADAPLLMFLDDDALPGAHLLRAHKAAFCEYDIISCRGAIFPRTNRSFAEDEKHYYLGDRPCVTFAGIEGNTSYEAQAFFQAGGWDDDIAFGGGGVDLAIRLLAVEPDLRKQIYYPQAVIYHDFAANEEEARAKKERQEMSLKRLESKHPDFHFYTTAWLLHRGIEQFMLRRQLRPESSRPSDAAGSGGRNTVLGV